MLSPIRKVMLIDDDEDDHLFFEEALRDIDPAVEVVHLYGAQDLPKAGGCNIPDLLFLDMNMPGWNGFTWLKKIAEAKYNFPAVIYSTSATPEEMTEADHLGACLYVKKPTNFSIMKKVLETVLQMDWQHPEQVKHAYYGKAW